MFAKKLISMALVFVLILLSACGKPSIPTESSSQNDSVILKQKISPALTILYRSDTDNITVSSDIVLGKNRFEFGEIIPTHIYFSKIDKTKPETASVSYNEGEVSVKVSNELDNFAKMESMKPIREKNHKGYYYADYEYESAINRMINIGKKSVSLKVVKADDKTIKTYRKTLDHIMDVSIENAMKMITPIQSPSTRFVFTHDNKAILTTAISTIKDVSFVSITGKGSSLFVETTYGFPVQISASIIESPNHNKESFVPYSNDNDFKFFVELSKDRYMEVLIVYKGFSVDKDANDFITFVDTYVSVLGD